LGTYHNFADIWFTYTIGEAVYFISDDYIFKWYDKSFKVWKADERYGFAGLVNDKIYIDNKGIGVMRLLNDSLMLIPDGDRFAGKKGGFTTFLPYKEDKILMGRVLEGLFLYDHKKFIPFKKNGQNLLYKKYVYGGKVLPNGDFVLFTPGNGCFILDEEGNIKQWLSKKRGLTSDVILGNYVDREGSLWLATEKGITRVEISSPLRIFGQQNGLSEGAHRIAYHKNQLYVATLNGILYLKDISDDSEKKNFHFQNIEGIIHQTWDLLVKGDYLIAGNFQGLYLIDPKQQVQQLTTENTSDLCPSLIDTNCVYAGTMYGSLYKLKFVGNQWNVEIPKLSIDGRIIKIEENPDGSLWIGTRYNGVYRLDWSDDNVNKTFDKNYTLAHYDTSDGLPEISYNAAFRANDEIYFSTQAGIYRFDEKDQKFKPDRKLMEQINITNTAYGLENWIRESAIEGMWISIGSNVDNNVYKYEKGVAKEVIPSKRFSDFGVYDIYELNDIVFFSGIKGSIGYNQQVNKNYNITFHVNLRRVSTKNDSLLFGGHLSKKFPDKEISLAYNNNYLRFVYALPSYDNSELNQYQFFLEGFEESWSGWTTETQRDFTNLSEGDYIFHVKGRNIYGKISNEAQFAFTILPPWHRTWWAYLFYGLAALGIVGIIVQWRSRHLRKEKETLENIVKERTRELAEKTEQLQEMDKQKSRFFANISHEFRTPLTLIKGPVEQVLSSQENSLSKEDEIMIKNNANRLLRLVNQLLDLSKLDADNLQLNLVEGDIFEFLRAVSSAFSSHAEQRNIKYYVQVPAHKLYTMFDHDKMEKIVYNLLSNAFKFTPDNGEIKVNAFYNNGLLKIEVSDTGIGIPQDQHQFIFDRFYQTDNSSTREKEGTGIGLSLTKELINLMKGEIKVESRLGRGSKFIVTLPAPSPVLPQRGRETETQLPDGEETRKLGRMKGVEVSLNSAEKREISEASSLREGIGDRLFILIVEDNTDMRNFIRKQLENDYSILEAPQGKEGLKMAKKEIPDLVITDLMMPQMDGMEFCKKLKTDEYTNHIPVIMLTAKAGQEHKVEGLKTGADSYLTKPFDHKELRAIVNNLIQQRKQLREKFSREIILQPRDISITGMDEQFLKKVEHIIEQNLPDEKFGIPQMQNALAMSKTQLHRKMKALTNQAPGEYLRHYRLRRAAQILSQQGGNITEIAYEVGFGSLSYFTRSFKELYNQSPSEYASQNSKTYKE
jgi:signal transduction histidine kinase/DNA-binding response OmpR family regulator